jgi:thiamine biosynthesis lipoprotein
MNQKNFRQLRPHDLETTGKRCRATPVARRLRATALRLAVCGLTLVGMSLGPFVAARAVAAEPRLERFESTRPQMGVPFKILLYAPDSATANHAFDAAFSRVEALNRVLSDYDSQSELSRLSRSSPTAQGIPISEDLWIVMARSQSLAGLTGGAFDVTVGPYVRLWRRARRSGEMPTPERLAEARGAVGYQHLKLDGRARTAQLLRPGMRLDLGGIAMGYAVDETVKLLRQRGLTRVLVDASGDIAVGDPPPGKPGWTIDVMPLSTDGSPARRILLANAAVTTAGDAFQHVVIDGVRYSHIVDPRTGLGVTDRVGVAVIARDCLTADSLDTAASVLGPKAALALIESTPGAEAFIVRPTDGEPEILESRGFKAFVVPNRETSAHAQ